MNKPINESDIEIKKKKKKIHFVYHTWNDYMISFIFD